MIDVCESVFFEGRYWDMGYLITIELDSQTLSSCIHNSHQIIIIRPSLSSLTYQAREELKRMERIFIQMMKKVTGYFKGTEVNVIKKKVKIGFHRDD
jgi:hypothetical protein